jgi:phosphoadenosine phosphosulfate reductase
MNKIERTIESIQKMEYTALQFSPDGFYLNFSGGKDSQVIYHLTKMSGVKFTSHMQLTTVDPPELLKFVKENYPDVIMHKPKMSMFQIIKKKRMMPLRQVRFCCAILKEQGGVGYVNILGIRKAESNQRAKRNIIETNKNKKLNYSNTLDQFNIDKEMIIGCIQGNDKIMFSPIIDWTDNEVYCGLYDKGFHRIGCIFCPMEGRRAKQKERQLFPKFEYAYKKAIRYCMDTYGYANNFTDSEDEVFDWYCSNKSMEEYFGNLRNQLKLDLNYE